MTLRRSTAPKPAYLRAVQNQQWTVSGALNELVDNSFGTSRGNATEVRLAWYIKERILTVLDNGSGIDDLTRLFQLGNTIGRGVGDIGEYGSGGTMALIWLGRRVHVWTMRRGRVAFTTIDWNKHIQAGLFPEVDPTWYRATDENTPAELLTQGHGTYIALELPHKRRISPNTIINELAVTYGPALRQGRKVIWQSIPEMTVFRDRPEHVTERILGEEIAIPNAIDLQVAFELNGHRLTAYGKAGFVEGLSVSHSSIAIGFGPRLLLRTKDCYHGDNQTFNGVGVTGYLDLADGWQPFLSTTKAVVDDAQAWDELMLQLFRQLRPLLKDAQRQACSLLLEGLQLDLQFMLNGPMDVKHAAGEDGVEPGPEENGGRWDMASSQKPSGPIRIIPPPAPKAPTPPLQLKLEPVSDRELQGALCRIDVQGRSLGGTINEDHPFVQAAMASRPPNRLAFYHLVITGIVDGILHQRPALLDEMLKPAARELIKAHEDDPQLRRGLLVRILLDHIREAA